MVGRETRAWPSADATLRFWATRLWLPGLLSGGAFVARMATLHSPSYGDEGWHFQLTKHWLSTPAGLHDVFGQNWWHAEFVFWQRPAFYVLFHWPAAVSFEAARVAQIVVASALPALAYALLSTRGFGRVTSSVAGAILAFHPTLVGWGSLFLMDNVVTVFFLAGVLGLMRNRVRAGAAFLLLAEWTKEIAIWGVLLLWAFTYLRRHRGNPRSAWPIRLDRTESMLAIVLALGPLPLMVSLSNGLPLPGAPAHGSTWAVLEMVALSSWLVPVLVVGLFAPRSRLFAAGALLWIGSYLILHGVFGRAVEGWYSILPATLTVLGVTATLAESVRAPSKRTRGFATAVAACLVLLMAGQVVVAESEAKAMVVHPLGGGSVPSLRELYGFRNRVEDADFTRAVQRMEDARPRTLLAVDLHYGWLYYPILEERGSVLVAGTGLFSLWPQPFEPLVEGIQGNGTVMFLQEQATPLNVALREAYEPCRLWTEGRFSAYGGSRCEDQLEWLRAHVPYPEASPAG